MRDNFARRRFLQVTSAFGLAHTLFPGVLWGLAQSSAAPASPAPAASSAAPQAQAPAAAPRPITKEMIDEAATIAGVDIADEYKEMMLDGLNTNLGRYKQIYALKLKNEVSPAIEFNPVLPGMKFETAKRPIKMSVVRAAAGPKNIEDCAFMTVRELAELVRTKRVSSTNLTEMYLERLKRYDSQLKFVITLTEDRARAQAKAADADIARGKYRGPLHGIPWGAKDLLAVKGYKTTWGAAGFEDQQFDYDAEVVTRLDRAGAVLVAKLTLGALAQGDVWFGGTTKNPWFQKQGSSGSSAGPGSAVAAGCVGFAIGSETLGSISSPSTRNGVTGLRPTFGRVPRTGAMALSWSMDKLGPMCRGVEDCALVLAAIAGPDGRDRTVRDIPFSWDATLHPRTLRVGYTKKDFDAEPPANATEAQKAARAMNKKFDDDALEVLRKLGVQLIPVEMPDLPWAAMRTILTAEAAAAFDDLTRSGRDKLLTAQKENDWPNTFRTARFIPAVEYVNANRARMLGMEAMAKVFEKVDVIVAPTFSNQLLITNLTGHPAVILPSGFRASDAPEPTGPFAFGGPNTPVSLTFIGDLFAEAKLLATAKAYQDATEWHKKYPKLGER